MSNVHGISTDIFRGVQVAFREPGKVAIGALALLAGVNAAEAETPSPSLRGSALPVAEEAAHRSLTTACAQVVPSSCINSAIEPIKVSSVNYFNDGCCAGVVQGTQTNAFTQWASAPLTLQSDGTYCNLDTVTPTLCDLSTTTSAPLISFDLNSVSIKTDEETITIHFETLIDYLQNFIPNPFSTAKDLPWDSFRETYNEVYHILLDGGASEIAQAEVQTLKDALQTESNLYLFDGDLTNACKAQLKIYAANFVKVSPEDILADNLESAKSELATSSIIIGTMALVGTLAGIIIGDQYHKGKIQSLLCCSTACQTSGKVKKLAHALGTFNIGTCNEKGLFCCIPAAPLAKRQAIVELIVAIAQWLLANEESPTAVTDMNTFAQWLLDNLNPTALSDLMAARPQNAAAGAAIEGGDADGRPLDHAYADNE